MLVAAWLKMEKRTTTEPQAGDRTRPGSAGGDQGLAVAGGWLALAQGRPAEGAAAARWALRAARTHGAPWLWQPGAMRLVAQLGLAAGDQKLASEAAAVAELAAARNPEVPVFGGLACQVRGLAQGDASLLGRAWELLRSSPRPLLRASAAQDYGRRAADRAGRGVTRGRGAPAGRGVGRVRPGRRLGRAAGSRTDAAPGRGPPGQVGGGTRRAPLWPARGWDALTDAERKVAELVSSGHTNRSTARPAGPVPQHRRHPRALHLQQAAHSVPGPAGQPAATSS